MNPALIQVELQLTRLKHKHLSPQIHFATLTHDNQIEAVQFSVETETVLLLENDNCHLNLVDFRDDQFPIRNNNKVEKIFTKPLVIFSL